MSKEKNSHQLKRGALLWELSVSVADLISDLNHSEMRNMVIYGLPALKDMSDKELIEYSQNDYNSDGDGCKYHPDLFKLLDEFEAELAIGEMLSET